MSLDWRTNETGWTVFGRHATHVGPPAEGKARQRGKRIDKVHVDSVMRMKGFSKPELVLCLVECRNGAKGV